MGWRWDVMFGSMTITLIALTVSLKGDKMMYVVAAVFAVATVVAFLVHRHRGAR